MSLVKPLWWSEAQGRRLFAIRRPLGQATALLVLFSLPILLAIWCLPGFVTQDGPAHLYNAHVMHESLHAGSPFQDYYAVQWLPIPNWAGHLSLLALISVVPPWVADRLMMTGTYALLAGAILGLRWQVAGDRGLPLAVLFAVLLSINVSWLLGFASFLLGTVLFAVTLAVWWARGRPLSPARALAVACLLVLGYFCHPVSLGLTVFALGVLTVATPGPGLRRRLGWSLACIAPLLPLLWTYRQFMTAQGRVVPLGSVLTDAHSLRGWADQLLAADPLSLAGRTQAPFLDSPSRWFVLCWPMLWLVASLGSLAVATLAGKGADSSAAPRRGWAVLAALLIGGGLLAPENLGVHGGCLQFRIVLLGLVALVPVLDLARRGWLSRLGACAAGLALVLQFAFLWDYALASDRWVASLALAKSHVGTEQRLAAMSLCSPMRYRANPIRHADCLLGIQTGNVVWTNYEADKYYFPVHVSAAISHPRAEAFASIRSRAVRHDPGNWRGTWNELVDRYHGVIDVLVIWGNDPALDARNAGRYRTIFADEHLMVLRRGARSVPGE